jgi:hypothetical protein
MCELFFEFPAPLLVIEVFEHAVVLQVEGLCGGPRPFRHVAPVFGQAEGIGS